MKPKTKKKAKAAEEPIHLGQWGDLTELRFGERTTARAIFSGYELRDVLSAMERYVLRRQKIPSPKLLSALDTLRAYFAAHGASITVTADLFVGFHGVRLEQIVPGEDGEPDDEETQQ